MKRITIKTPLALLSLSLASVFIGTACSEDDSKDESATEDKSTGEPDYEELSSPLFSTDELMRVEIEIDPDSWDALRYEPPGLDHFADPDCPNGPRPRVFTWYPASASVNGEDYGQIEVRKKGFMGSMEPNKTSIKLRFGQGEVPWGLAEMTLNNTVQDPTWARQCLSYGLFRKARLTAPRCGLAQVSVNGHDLGIYTHVEAIEDPLLEAQLGDSGGDLYEITSADFVPELLVNFDLKGNRRNADRSHLETLSKALEAEDSTLFESLEKSLDVDEFFDFWAMEVITAHWDSYSGNRNNSFVYRHPDDGLFHFIPWGTDQAFEKPEDWWGAFLNREPYMPWSVYANGAIARRLYQHPQGRERYQARLRELLDSVWVESDLIEEIDTIFKTISPVLDDRLAEDTADQELALKSFIRAHKERILKEINDGLNEWNRSPNPTPCIIARKDASGELEMPTVFTGTVQTVFGTSDEEILSTGSGQVTETSLGEELQMDRVQAVVDFDDDHMGWRNIRLVIGFGPTTNGYYAVLEITMPEEIFHSGNTVLMNFGEARTGVAWFDFENNTQTKAGFVGNGEILLDNVDTTVGSLIELSITAPLAALRVP